jgi:hypothetical protein
LSNQPQKRTSTRVILIVAIVCLVVGAAVGIVGWNVFQGRNDECVATVATGGTREVPENFGRRTELEITNKVAGHKINGVCVPN